MNDRLRGCSLAAALVAALAGCDAAEPSPAPPPPIVPRASKGPAAKDEPVRPEVHATPGIEARLVRITDGDTIVVEVDGQRERVRLIGIDTPETKHSPRGPEPFADEATNALRSLLADSPLTLRLDAEERDRYGRLLAYVYVGEEFVNAQMVRQGWARALRIPPNVRHAKELERLASEARRAQRGLWSG